MLNKDEGTCPTVVRDKAQKIVSVMEMSSNRNSVRRITPHKDGNSYINTNNLSEIDKKNKLASPHEKTSESPNAINDTEKEKFNFFDGKHFNETEDWNDLLKQSNMSKEEFLYYSKNRALIKIMELIENMNKLLRDKNFQIKILLDENKNLNEKNEDLNKENMLLNKQNMHLLKESIKYNEGYKHTKGDTGMDSSMVNYNK